MQIFNFCDGHVTTFLHHSGAYICQMPGHRLSRLAKGTPSESQLSIGTIALGVKMFPVGCAQDSRRVPIREKCCFGSDSTHAKNSGIFHDSTHRLHHFDSLPPKTRRSVVFRVHYKYTAKPMLRLRRQ